MFDPTVFENVKVVLEGSVYDLDLEGTLIVTRRSDQIDMSSMSRTYAIEFAISSNMPSRAEIKLHAHLSDLAAEILENPSAAPGCTLEVRLYTQVRQPARECPQIAKQVSGIWGHRPDIRQKLSYEFGADPVRYGNEIALSFGRKIDEGQIDDFPHLIGCAVESLLWLDERGI